MAAAFLTLAIFLPRPSGDVMIWIIAAIGVIALIQSLISWHYATTNPTVVDITSKVIALTLASGKRIVIPREDLSGIHAVTPRRMIGRKGRISSLTIRTSIRSVRLLPRRDYVEVRWLAHELRKAVGLPADDPSEPLLNEAMDRQEVPDEEVDPTIKLPDPKQTTTLPRSRRAHAWRRGLSREYDNLGCGATLFLLATVLVGMVVINRTLGIAAICLQFGTDAYFRRGLDYVPHRGLQLNNVQKLGPPYVVVYILGCFVALVIWTGGALILTIGLNKLVDYRNKRRRNKRASVRRASS